MTTTFTWTVESIDTIPNDNGTDHIAQLVHWRVTGTDGTNIASTAGTTHIPFSDAGQFTPFNDLTATQVVGWVKTTLDTPAPARRSIAGAPDDLPSNHLSTTDYEAIVAEMLSQKAGLTVPWAPPPPPSGPHIPQFVTMREAKLALYAAGLLDQVTTAINALPSPHKELATIEWTSASMVYRNSAFVTSLGQGLGLTEKQIDDLFTAAAGL